MLGIGCQCVLVEPSFFTGSSSSSSPEPRVFSTGKLITKRGGKVPNIQIPTYHGVENVTLPDPVACGTGARYICLPVMLKSTVTSPVNRRLQLVPLVNMSNFLAGCNPECESIYIGTPTSPTPPLLQPIPVRLAPVEYLSLPESVAVKCPPLPMPVQSSAEERMTPSLCQTCTSPRLTTPFRTARSNALSFELIKPTEDEVSPVSTATTENCCPMQGLTIEALPFQNTSVVLAEPCVIPVSGRALKAADQWVARQVRARAMKVTPFGKSITFDPSAETPRMITARTSVLPVDRTTVSARMKASARFTSGTMATKTESTRQKTGSKVQKSTRPVLWHRAANSFEIIET